MLASIYLRALRSSKSSCGSHIQKHHVETHFMGFGLYVACSRSEQTRQCVPVLIPATTPCVVAKCSHLPNSARTTSGRLLRIHTAKPKATKPPATEKQSKSAESITVLLFSVSERSAHVTQSMKTKPWQSSIFCRSKSTYSRK